MPSKFSQQFGAGALPALTARFGISGSAYQDLSVGPLACAPRLRRGKALQTVGKNGARVEIQPAEIDVMKSEVPQPIREGRFTIDGEVWSIEKHPSLVNECWRCECVRITNERLMSKVADARG